MHACNTDDSDFSIGAEAGSLFSKESLCHLRPSSIAACKVALKRQLHLLRSMTRYNAHEVWTTQDVSITSGMIILMSDLRCLGHF